MKNLMILILSLSITALWAQQPVEHISKLELGKKDKKVFHASRDSSAVIHIDTLIMKDRSSLQFYGKHDVKLVVKYAEIGDRVFISGRGRQNNASDIDIHMNIQKLGSLYVIAKGEDAFNGTKTHPNGDGGDVNFTYSSQGIVPQSTDKKGKNYLFIDAQPGGLRVNASSEVQQIYSMINVAPTGLRGIPQGQIYSGSPGTEGKVVVRSE